MSDTPTRRAREALARQIEAQGPAWKNTANSIRSGFSNLWIAPALLAIEAAMRAPVDDEDGSA